MNIKEIKKDFFDKKLTKMEFINSMHEFHKVLFDFAENLCYTEIARIEIEDKNVIFISRKSEHHPGDVKFYVDILDKRITPIDTFNFDKYEQQDSDMLYRLVKDGDTIFDIGTNIGWYSIHLSKKLPNSKIYSFEPIPETFNQLKSNCEINNSTNIILNNFPFSDKIQNLTFYYSPSITGASSSVNITENENMIELNCTTNTIDKYVKDNEIKKIDFIKCDVEGAELLVFKGGFQSIKKYGPIVFTEMLRKWAAKFNYHPNDIIKFFTEIGYCCYFVSENKLCLIEEVTEDTIETNFFFFNPNKHKSIIQSLS